MVYNGLVFKKPYKSMGDIMFIEETTKLGFNDVLIRPKRSELGSRKDVKLSRRFTFKYSGDSWEGVPIIASNMDGVGTLEMANALSQYDMLTTLVKSYDLTQVASLPPMDAMSISIGIKDSDIELLNKTLTKHPNIKFITIDVANGYSERFGRFVAKVRALYPKKTIIAGNVVTGDMVQELVLRGADIVKIGIGPGSVCTTRIKTGVGYPQLSAIMECADAAHGLGAHIVADGGCTSPGDVSKAFGAGADFVMLGGLLAGYDQGGGEVIERTLVSDEMHENAQGNLERAVKTKQFVRFYGMSSDTAMMKHEGHVPHYRSSEGRTVEIPYQGDVEPTLRDILGGVRSTCTYVGAKRLKDLSKCTTFIKVNKQYNDVFENR